MHLHGPVGWAAIHGNGSMQRCHEGRHTRTHSMRVVGGAQPVHQDPQITTTRQITMRFTEVPVSIEATSRVWPTADEPFAEDLGLFAGVLESWARGRWYGAT